MGESKDAEEQQTIENIQEVFKRRAYLVGNQLLKHAQCFNQYLYYFLIVIESLQILWFSIHPTFEFLRSIKGMAELQTGLSYIHLQHVMRTVQGSWSLLILICVLVVAIHIGSIIITISLVIKKSHLANLFGRITSIQIFVFNTILVGPIVNVISITLYCDARSEYHMNETCYTPSYIIFCVVASIMALCILVETIAFSAIYFSKNPFNRSCIATPENLVALVKFLLKLLPCIYFISDPVAKYRIVYIFAFPAIMIGYLYFFRVFSRHHFNQRYFYFTYCCQIVIAWFTIVNIMHFYLTSPTKPNLCLIYTVISCFPLCYTLVRLQQSSKNQIFLQGIRNVKKNKQIAEQFLQQIIYLVEKYSWSDNRTKLIAFMKIHSSNCQKDSQCICRNFLRDFYQKKKLTNQQQHQQMYLFLKYLMLDNIKKYPSMIIFKLSYAYLLYMRLNSKVQGVYVATEAGKQKLSFSEQFMVYRMKIQFEQEMQHTQQQANVQKGHSIRVYLEFNKQLLNLEQQIQSCAQDSLEYWCELTQDSPSVLKLWNMAKRCEIKAKSAKKYFNKIMDIYPNNLKSLHLYSDFLKEIVLNIKEYQKLQERIKSEKITNNTCKDSSTDMKFRQNSNLCIVTISALSGSMGSIVNCNSEMQNLLQYGKGEIVGQKIIKIMPKIYHQVHDGFLTKYISKPDAEIVSREITIFPINKNGYICECVLFVKLLPDFEDGFHLAGFLRKLDHCADTFYLMYDSTSLEVQQISQNCLGLGFIEDYMQKSHNAHTITMNYLFPQFHFEEANPEIFRNQGYSTVIDLRIVSDQFEDDLEQSPELNATMLRKVQIQLVSEASYNSKTRVKIIKFTMKMTTQQLLQTQERQRGRLGTNCSQNGRKMMDHRFRRRDEVSADEVSAVDEETMNYKKFTSFISQKKTKIMLVLLIICAYLFLAFQVVLVSVDLSRNINDSSEVLMALSHLNNTQSMPLYIGRIVFTSKKLTLTNKLQLNESQFEKYRGELNKTLMTTQQTLVQLIRQDIVMTQMGYDPPKLQSTLSFENNNVVLSQQSQYNDGVFQLITTGIYLVNKTYETYNQQNLKIEEMSFITLNSLTTFLTLADSKTRSIAQYFDNRFETYVEARKIMLCLRIISIILVFLIIFPIIIKLDHTNQKLLGIYKILPLADIRQVQSKCQGFISEHFEEVAQKYKMRTDSIAQHASKKLIDNEGQLPLLSDLKEDEEECLQKKVPKVHLSQIPGSKEQMCFLAIFTLIMLANFIGQFFLYSIFFQPLRNYQRNLLNLGQVRNTNRLVLMFSQEYLADGTYKPQLLKSMSDLYWKIENLYTKVPERNKVRERIYGKIEQIRSLMQNQNISQLKSPLYVDAQQTLLQAQLTLNNQINAFVTQWQTDIRDTFRRSFNIKFACEFICVLVLIKILISGYLQRLITKTKRSINMVMMIPPDIISKNKDIITLF